MKRDVSTKKQQDSTKHSNAKRWLIENGFSDVASLIEDLERQWARAGKKTRRNWWDVLAGAPDGTPRIVGGRRFPVFAEARRRQGLMLSTGSPEPSEEDFPDVAETAGVASSLPAAPPIPRGQGTGRSEESAVPPLRMAAVSPTMPPSPSLLMDANSLAYLERQIELARVTLVTGAGFTKDAKDTSGLALPIGAELAREIWTLCYPDSEYVDGNTFSELYAVAADKHARKLRELLKRRLHVDPASLASYYRIWFGQPWKRIYTLNYDDLEVAAAHRFELPREPVTVSGTTDDIAVQLATEMSNKLQVVHLNGFLSDGLRDMTASPQDYGVRLGRSEPWYEALVAELCSSTCLFVGTKLDESILWKYIELRGKRRGAERRQRAFLICPTLTRARQDLLNIYHIQWIKTDAGAFAENVLGALSGSSARGLARLIADDTRSPNARIPEVSELLERAGRSDTDFLLGEQPAWSDIAVGRAATRASESELLNRIAEVRSRTSDNPCTVVVITGTAGSGKSTMLMQVAAALVGRGKTVGWIGPDVDISASVAARAARAGSFNVVAIDDIDRFGRRAGPLVEEFAGIASVELLVLTVRSSRADIVDQVSREKLDIVEYPMPTMCDEDISAILDVLDKFHRLGRLKALGQEQRRHELRMRADRQLLVALIEATSGQRFDDKVLGEWEDLPAEQRMCYTVAALAYSLRETLAREDVLLALSSLPKETAYGALQRLLDRRILVETSSGTALRPRHRVIADKLLTLLGGQPNLISEAVEQLAYAMASRIPPGSVDRSRSWRLLTRLTNHEFLFRRLGVANAQRLYSAIEELVHWDYHFWLQRGELELEEGSVRLAEQYLNQAYSLRASDPIVVTAYAHMLMRKAVCSPAADDAEAWLRQGVDYLRGQIAGNAKRDEYPFHVLGAQSLAWVSKAPWALSKKVKFLQTNRTTVEQGVALHAKSDALRQLAKDMQKKVLALQTGLA